MKKEILQFSKKKKTLKTKRARDMNSEFREATQDENMTRN